jgi:hypothetical protein
MERMNLTKSENSSAKILRSWLFSVIENIDLYIDKDFDGSMDCCRSPVTAEEFINQMYNHKFHSSLEPDETCYCCCLMIYIDDQTQADKTVYEKEN